MLPKLNCNYCRIAAAETFEIAMRLGLSDEVIENARDLIKNEAIRFEETLIKIDEKASPYRKAEHDAIIRLKREN